MLLVALDSINQPLANKLMAYARSNPLSSGVHTI